jgi:hypothetical protein
MPTDRCPVGGEAGAVEAIGARTKWRGETVADLKRQPVKNIAMIITNVQGKSREVKLAK